MISSVFVEVTIDGQVVAYLAFLKLPICFNQGSGGLATPNLLSRPIGEKVA